MKTVVIVASDFTPSSYPPALRVRFFAEHLEEFGWKPIVLTINPNEYEWEVDAENGQLLPNNLEVLRTNVLPIKWTRKLGIGDLGIRTLWQHWRALVKLCKDNRVDAVFIPVPSYYPAILGRLIHRQFKVPYVIDYIDPWVYSDYWQRPRAHRNLKRSVSHVLSAMLEPFALKNVGHLVAVSKGTTDGVIERYSWLCGIGTSEIPYGAPTADFAYLRKNVRTNSIFRNDDGFVHLSYVGRGGVDMKPALIALFQAVKNGLASNPATFEHLRLHFIGTTYAANGHGQYQVMPLVREFGLENYIDEHPARVSYLDALQILIDSHALVVTGSNRAHYTASKIFPYIMSRKQLLAIFHEDSSVVKIIRDTNAGQVVTFNSSAPPETKVEEILQGLESILSNPSNQPETNWQIFDQYSTRSMTAKLADALNKATENRNVTLRASESQEWEARSNSRRLNNQC